MRTPTAILGLLLVGCDPLPDPAYVYGESLADLTFTVIDPDQGVYPNTSILTHPENPFSQGISLEAKFAAQEQGPIPAFYAWAQALVQEPTGEHQFFAAAAAHDIYSFGLADDADLVYARSIAVRGYQNCLEVFPDSTATYDATGNVRYDLLAQVLLGLDDLGGEVPLGWSLITEADGSLTAVYSGY